MIEGQTYRRINRWTDGQADRSPNTRTNWTEEQPDSKIDRQREGQTDRR